VASAAFRTEALEVRTIAWLKELLGELIQMDTARIRGNRKLEEYGLDSIMIVEITNRMEEVLGPLSKTLFFEYVDLDSLGAYIAGEHGAALSALFSEEEVTAPEVTQDVSEPEVPPVQARAAPSEDPGRPERDSRDIAIVGMSLCVSGASDQQSFWRMLEQGLHGFERFPSDRWDHDALLHPERDVPGKTVVQTGAFLDGIDQFDPRYFRISQAEAELMSPEVRLFLQSCRLLARDHAAPLRRRCGCDRRLDDQRVRPVRLREYAGAGRPGQRQLYRHRAQHGVLLLRLHRPVLLPGHDVLGGSNLCA
jgi:acyl carrier protein